MDGNFLTDERAPWLITDPTAVTLATTDKAIFPVGNIPPLGSNYWWAGKVVNLRLFGRLTTVLTPGNGTFSLYWGNGADANGTVLQATAAFPLTASMTNTTWWADLVIRCRAIGASGSLLVTGTFGLLNSATSTAAGEVRPIPATAPAPVTVDLTAANIISPQFKRSGSTAETIQGHEFSYQAKN